MLLNLYKGIFGIWYGTYFIQLIQFIGSYILLLEKLM